jgi:hypothetical protein
MLDWSCPCGQDNHGGSACGECGRLRPEEIDEGHGGDEDKQHAQEFGLFHRSRMDRLEKWGKR